MSNIIHVANSRTVEKQTLVNVAEAILDCFMGYVRVPLEHIMSKEVMFGGE